jgi:hypothetical protein
VEDWEAGWEEAATAEKEVAVGTWMLSANV